MTITRLFEWHINVYHSFNFCYQIDMLYFWTTQKNDGMVIHMQYNLGILLYIQFLSNNQCYNHNNLGNWISTWHTPRPISWWTPAVPVRRHWADVGQLYILHIPGWWFGTWLLWLSIYWGCHHSKWRTHIFQRGRYTTNQIHIIFV